MLPSLTPSPSPHPEKSIVLPGGDLTWCLRIRIRFQCLLLLLRARYRHLMVHSSLGICFKNTCRALINTMFFFKRFKLRQMISLSSSYYQPIGSESYRVSGERIVRVETDIRKLLLIDTFVCLRTTHHSKLATVAARTAVRGLDECAGRRQTSITTRPSLIIEVTENGVRTREAYAMEMAGSRDEGFLESTFGRGQKEFIH